MKTNLKIKVSNEAFDFINKLLEFHIEYDCISLKESTSSGCCKNSKIEVLLDNIHENYITENIHGLNVAYISELPTKFKEIVIILKDNTLYLKATSTEENSHNNSCGQCKSASKNCSNCSGCSGCNCKNKN